MLLSEEGRLGEALAEAKVAQQLDPLSLSINRNLAQVFGYLHQYDKAVEQYRKTLELDPNFPSAHFGFGGILGL